MIINVNFLSFLGICIDNQIEKEYNIMHTAYNTFFFSEQLRRALILTLICVRSLQREKRASPPASIKERRIFVEDRK